MFLEPTSECMLALESQCILVVIGGVLISIAKLKNIKEVIFSAFQWTLVTDIQPHSRGEQG